MKRVLVTTVPDQEHTLGQSVSLRHDKHEFLFLMSIVSLQFLSNEAIYSAQEGVVVMKFCHTAPIHRQGGGVRGGKAPPKIRKVDPPPP